jgi:tetratricopeptide (TPR) repeat protein
MEISVLDAQMSAPGAKPGEAYPSTSPNSETDLSSRIFTYLLSRVADNGGLLVDLGAGACIFARIARDDGYAVTAVDTGTELKPTQEELGTIRFVQSDLQEFDLRGFDIIVLHDVLHQFDLDKQMQFLKRCAKANVPVILEMRICADSRVATEQAVLGMFADAGFKTAVVVEPRLPSEPAAHRFFLLNCGKLAEVTEAEIVKRERNRIVALVNQGRFDEAHEIYKPIAAFPASDTDWLYEFATGELNLHFGEHEKAVATVVRLRDRALSFVTYGTPALLQCARFFDAAGNVAEAENTRRLAIGRLNNSAAIRTLVRRLMLSKAHDDARRILGWVERRSADDPELFELAAQTYQAIGDFAAAERVCRAALEREPRNIAMLAILADALSGQDKQDDVVTALERALALEPSNMKFLERLIVACLKLRRFEEAERHARAVLAVSPDNPQVHLYLAGTLKRTRRRLEALEHARRAVELAPANEHYRKYADDLAKPVAQKAGTTRSGGIEAP